LLTKKFEILIIWPVRLLEKVVISEGKTTFEPILSVVVLAFIEFGNCEAQSERNLICECMNFIGE